MKDAFMHYWNDRTPREKRVLAWGAAFLLLAVLYAYVWLPLARYRTALVEEVPRLRASAAQMREDTTTLGRLRAVGTAPAGDPQSRVTTSLKNIADVTPRVSAEGDGRIRVVFDAISVDAWLRWITAVAVEHRLHVETARVEVLEAGKGLRATAVVSGGNR